MTASRALAGCVLCIALSSCAGEPANILGDRLAEGAAVSVDGKNHGTLVPRRNPAHERADADSGGEGVQRADVVVAEGEAAYFYRLTGGRFTPGQGQRRIMVVTGAGDTLRRTVVFGEYPTLYISVARGWIGSDQTR